MKNEANLNFNQARMGGENPKRGKDLGNQENRSERVVICGGKRMNEEKPIEFGIAELMDECAQVFLRKEDEARERLIKFNCSSCRYAKVCNPRRGVEGIHVEYKPKPLYPSKDNEYYLESGTRVVRFVCSKKKPRKTPIPFEETRIYKMAYKKEKIK